MLNQRRSLPHSRRFPSLLNQLSQQRHHLLNPIMLCDNPMQRTHILEVRGEWELSLVKLRLEINAS